MDEEKRNELNMKRRRRRRTVCAVFGCILVVGALFILSRIFIRARVIAIENGTKYTSEELISYCDTLRDKYLITLDRTDFCSDIVTDYPYIEAADISLIFPSTVRISLSGTSSAVCISVSDGKYIVTDGNLKVLEETDIIPESTVSVTGFAIEKYTVGNVLSDMENIEVSVLRDVVSSLIADGLFAYVSDIDFTKKYNLTFKLYDIIDVEMGNSENISDKTDMLCIVLSKNDTTVPAVISVRDPEQGRYRKK